MEFPQFTQAYGLGQADARGLENFSLFLSSFLTFGGDISRVLAPWKDGESFPSREGAPCPVQAHHHPLHYLVPQVHIYIFITIRGSLKGCWLIIAGFW